MREHLLLFMEHCDYPKDAISAILEAYDVAMADKESADVISAIIAAYDADVNCDYEGNIALCEKLSEKHSISKHTYERMFALFPEAVKALNEKKSNKALFDLVYLSVAATGLISGMARGSNQCAIAHKIYDLSRELFPWEIKDFRYLSHLLFG